MRLSPAGIASSAVSVAEFFDPAALVAAPAERVSAQTSLGFRGWPVMGQITGGFVADACCGPPVDSNAVGDLWDVRCVEIR